MEIVDILKKDQIFFDLECETQEEAIRLLSQTYFDKGLIEDQETYIQAVMEREVHSTTGIGNGIAIPHGKSTTVVDSSIIIAKTKNDIEWNSLDEKPVNLIFLLAISDSDKGDGHLRLLSQLAVHLMDDELVEEMKATNSADKIIELLSKGEDE